MQKFFSLLGFFLILVTTIILSIFFIIDFNFFNLKKKLYSNFPNIELRTKIFNKNLSQTVKFKYVGERRDYGNINNKFEDVILSKYVLVDLVTNYKLFDTFNLNISAKNILDKRYSEAYEYKAPGRSVNFILKKSY